jgi:hypothetical protein
MRFYSVWTLSNIANYDETISALDYPPLIVDVCKVVADEDDRVRLYASMCLAKILGTDEERTQTLRNDPGTMLQLVAFLKAALVERSMFRGQGVAPLEVPLLAMRPLCTLFVNRAIFVSYGVLTLLGPALAMAVGKNDAKCMYLCLAIVREFIAREEEGYRAMVSKDDVICAGVKKCVELMTTIPSSSGTLKTAEEMAKEVETMLARPN